jgi:hypothetical protein
MACCIKNVIIETVVRVGILQDDVEGFAIESLNYYVGRDSKLKDLRGYKTPNSRT